MTFLPIHRIGQPLGERRPTQTNTGAALVIVLGMVVLLTGLTVAFISRALQERQISVSSASQSKTDIFARGALESLVGDLRGEITAGSTTDSTGTLYRPKSGTMAAAPARVVLSETSVEANPNIVKQSARNLPFHPYGAGASRAAAVSTVDPALNGRKINAAGWNKPLLMPKHSPQSVTDLTPDRFQASDWILVARDGSNPTAWNDTLKSQPTGAGVVIGRYAYTIYNEGGLLDANVAGYPKLAKDTAPSGLSSISDQTKYKSSVAYADLTKIGLTQDQVNALLQWRNEATLAGSDSVASLNFFRFATQNPSQFLNTVNTSLFGGNSDKMFVSRQQLINFFSNQMVGNKADLQNILQYLGTFSRALNSPSYWPHPDRPKVVGGPATSSSTGGYSGGNSAHGSDDSYNPIFRAIKVVTAFDRNDGSRAVIGEPLVKKRFPLNYVCWITCEGPSANASSTVRTAYLDKGVSEELLDQGTDVNIKKCFGLSWTSGPGSGGRGGYWTYDHDIHYSDGSTRVGYLSDVRDLTGAKAREPDFFELIQAAVNVGSVAKSRTGIGMNVYNSKTDSLVIYQILQMGANIIDGANPAQFPTAIKFNYGYPGYLSVIYGNTDLPYYNAQVKMVFISRVAVPAPPPDGTPNKDVLSDKGRVVCLLVPQVWNPYEKNPDAPAMAPTELRISMTGENLTVPGTYTSWNCYPRYWTATETTADTTVSMAWNERSDTGLIFSNNYQLYREPTMFMFAGKPDGSNLAMDPRNLVRTQIAGLGVPEAAQPSNRFIGFLVCDAPQRFVKTNASGEPITYTVNNLGIGLPSTDTVLRLEYKVGTTWIPYQEAFLKPDGNGPDVPISATYPVLPGGSGGSLWGDQVVLPNGKNIRYHTLYAWDPRTTRFGYPSQGVAPKFLGDPLSGNVSTQSSRPGTAEDFLDYGIGYGDSPHAEGWFDVTGGFGRHIGGPTQNLNKYGGKNVGQCHYGDADWVARRAMGGGVSDVMPATPEGLPMATPAAASSRPIILHRPYRSVAELGTVFRGTPWKNFDFFNPESGDSALLDLFCINPDTNVDAVVAGKVDLNTRQSSVLQALLAGAYRDEFGTDALTTASEIKKIADKLVSRTSTQQPLANIADLIGTYKGGGTVSLNASIDPSCYDGFTADLATLFTSESDRKIQRFRESAIRALSDTGQAGTWNLLIDLIAQTGRYPSAASGLADFAVEGERRYWVHLAIDRQTGKVIDQKIEVVTE